MSEYSNYWDLVVKPLAKEVIEKVTVDKEMTKHYVSQMIFAVEHDLADGRGMGLMAINCLSQVSGVFNSVSYFVAIHGDTPEEEVNRMKKLAEEIKTLMQKNESA